MLCKVKLCQAILEFRHENADFEIWTLGDDAAKHYWGTFGETVAGRESVKEAIKKIIDIPQSSLNTDFVSLFDRIFENHKDLNLMKVSPTVHNLPGVVLVLVSDLLHDVKRKLNLNPTRNDFEKTLDEQKRNLNWIIDKISEGNILVDIIELKPRRIREHEIPVWEILNRNKFLGSRLKKISIENESIESLFPTINSLNRIIFYYNYASTILKSSVYLKFDKIGNYSIGLDPDKDNSKKSLKYEVMNVSNGNKEISAGKAGNFIAGGNFVQFKDLKPYESIKLTCSTFSSGEGFPDLKISFLDKEKINYSIPIVFKKKPLPLKQNIYVWAIFILLSLTFFLVIQLFYRSARFLKLKFSINAKRKERSALRPQEVTSDITTAPIDKDNLVPCPYPECPEGYHPQGAVFCPHSGKPLGASSRIKKRLLIISIVLLAIIIFIIIILNLINTTAKPKFLPQKEKDPKDNILTLPQKEKSINSENGETPSEKETIKDDHKGKEKKKPGTRSTRDTTKNKTQFDTFPDEISTKVETKEKGIQPPESAVDQDETIREVETLQVKDLPANIFNNYKNQLKSIGELIINENITVEGSINLCLIIDERGKIKVDHHDNRLLKVMPESKKRRVTDLLIKRINEHTLEPQKNSRGAYVKVINFRITIKVIQSQNTLKLQR